MSNLAHGGLLIDLIQRDRAIKEELLFLATTLPSLTLNDRQVCDLELILNGGFSPLSGFMNGEDYESVLVDMRLKNGLVWTIPITLDVSSNEVETLNLRPKAQIVLRNPQDDEPLAILTIQDIYRPNKSREAALVFGKDDSAHPAVQYLHETAKEFYVGGSLQAISLPVHYDYVELRLTPAELRQKFEKLNWRRVVAFQTRNPMHRAHRELTVRAARDFKCNVLIHPVVGMTKPGDIDHYTRVRVYKTIIEKYPDGMATLSLLPLAMRMGGPREAVWHAIIRKNYGCSHFIIGRDHAGPGKGSDGKDFYGPYDAQDLVAKFKDELDIQVVPFKMVSYVPETDEYIPADLVPAGVQTLNISGTELRRRLKTGASIPDWFTYPDVQKILRQVHPPRPSQGFAVLVTGNYSPSLLTIGNGLESVLNQSGQRPTTLLLPSTPEKNGSVSFASADEVKALAFVAGEVVKNGGAVIAVPLLQTRVQQDAFINAVKKNGGGIFLVHVDTSLEKAATLDRTGFYSKDRQQVEAPLSPTILANPSNQPISQIVHEVILELEQEGFIGSR